MKAIQFDASVPRYLLGKTLGAVYKPFFWSGLSCLRYGDAPEPSLPSPEWVKIRTRYGGICGSDWKLIQLHNSPYLSPFASKRFIPGHENLGTIVEVGPQVQGWSLGERVMADLMLPCAARGYADPCPACQRGDYNLCQRFAEGTLPPGTILGACADTGGSWGPTYVAHQSQLVRVPEGVSDENAILLDALGTALHSVLRHYPEDHQTALVLGAGTIGLCAIACLRALGSKARILALAKYPFQGDLARAYGSDEVVTWGKDSEHYHILAQLAGGKVYQPILGKPVLVGGADIVYECVGSDSSVDDALRLANAGGKVVLVGLAGVPKGVDWTPIWFHELTVAGTYCVAMETLPPHREALPSAGQAQGIEGEGRPEGMRTYEVGLGLMAQGKVDLTPLLTHRFRLAEHREAFRTLVSKEASRALKVVFTYE